MIWLNLNLIKGFLTLCEIPETVTIPVICTTHICTRSKGLHTVLIARHGTGFASENSFVFTECFFFLCKGVTVMGSPHSHQSHIHKIKALAFGSMLKWKTVTH